MSDEKWFEVWCDDVPYFWNNDEATHGGAHRYDTIAAAQRAVDSVDEYPGLSRKSSNDLVVHAFEVVAVSDAPTVGDGGKVVTFPQDGIVRQEATHG